MNQTENHKPTFDILKEAESIARKKGFPKGFHIRPKERPSKRVFLDRPSTDFQTGLPKSYVLSLFSKTSESFEDYSTSAVLALNQAIQDWQQQLTEASDSGTEIRKHIDRLQNKVEELDEKLTRHLNPRRDLIALLVTRYVNIVVKIEVVKTVRIRAEEDRVTIWTVIEAPPFQDELRIPIYDAQTEVLRMDEGNIRVDFNLVNVSEIPITASIEQIIPPNARCIWSRS